MYNFIYVFTSFVHVFLGVLQLLMLIRAVISWFPMEDEGSPFVAFVHMLTEPAIVPVRFVLNIFGDFDSFPIDIPFFITMVLLMAVETMLPLVII